MILENCGGLVRSWSPITVSDGNGRLGSGAPEMDGPTAVIAKGTLASLATPEAVEMTGKDPRPQRKREAGTSRTERISSLALQDCSKVVSQGGPKTSPGTTGAARTAMHSWSDKLDWDSQTWRRTWTNEAID
ncbi:hypothetical protein ABVT39_018080 [Epinephelus coioides]